MASIYRPRYPGREERSCLGSSVGWNDDPHTFSQCSDGSQTAVVISK